MPNSPLANPEGASGPPLRPEPALGPSDSSDSPSDLIGAEKLDRSDPNAPVDVATSEDAERSPLSSPAGVADSSDASATGERDAAAGDAGRRENADVLPDQIVGPGGPELGTDELGNLEQPEDTNEDDAEAEAPPSPSPSPPPATRPLPERGHTDRKPDKTRPEHERSFPDSGTATHGASSPRKV